MKNDKIITHVVLPINPEFIEEVTSKAIQTKDLILLEEGTEVFKLTRKKEDPNSLVIFAIYKSKELYDWHLEQDYVKSFFVFLQTRLMSAPTLTYLTEV